MSSTINSSTTINTNFNSLWNGGNGAYTSLNIDYEISSRFNSNNPDITHDNIFFEMADILGTLLHYKYDASIQQVIVNFLNSPRLDALRDRIFGPYIQPKNLRTNPSSVPLPSTAIQIIYNYTNPM